MAEIKRIKKGYDIPVKGGACTAAPIASQGTRYGIVPDDFPGYTWRLLVKAGDEVLTGTPLLCDKETGKIKIVSPVSGTVKSVHRGERRHIESIELESHGDGQIEYSTPNTADELRALLCEAGLWAMMRQRPYDIIPSPDKTPRDIFITAFDSAPLAPEILTTGDDRSALEEGIKALRNLTHGKIHLGVRFGSGIASQNAEVIEFQGPHPAGNVGVQIANIAPVNKGEIVWALDARTVARLGRLVTTGKIDADTEVLITGPAAPEACRVKTRCGAAIADLLPSDLVKEKDLRVVSGNVLSGEKVNPSDGYLRYPYRQISVLHEGAEADEFMGWASLSPQRFSVKSKIASLLHGNKPYDFDARIKGGHRAMILSGEYDKYLPMDIYGEYLIKAILAGDIDRMEKLGIYEVAPEDFALAEFADTSKLPLQQIVRDGLDYLRKEVE